MLAGTSSWNVAASSLGRNALRTRPVPARTGCPLPRFPSVSVGTVDPRSNRYGLPGTSPSAVYVPTRMPSAVSRIRTTASRHPPAGRFFLRPPRLGRRPGDAGAAAALLAPARLPDPIIVFLVVLVVLLLLLLPPLRRPPRDDDDDDPVLGLASTKKRASLVRL